MTLFHIVEKLDMKDHPVVVIVRQALIDILGNHNQVDDLEELPNDNTFEKIFIIAIGGDGTMLHAMNLASSIAGNRGIGVTEYAPAVFGFNLGKVGFLAGVNLKQCGENHHAIYDCVNSFLRDIFLEKAKYEKRSPLLAVDTTTGEMFTAFNEILITPSSTLEYLTYEFTVDGVGSGFHSANGLLISTPTGSTAYSHSVGGALVFLTANILQISPVAPMSRFSRSVIVPDSAKIGVKIKHHPSKNASGYQLVADGQPKMFSATGFENFDFLQTSKGQFTSFTRVVGISLKF